jgi:HEAT repeat protein
MIALLLWMWMAQADPASLAATAAKWDYGQDRAPLDSMSEAARASMNDPAKKRAMEQAFLGLLGSSSTEAAKDYACRELSIIGGDASVPALARLLADPKLGEISRYALERIPGKSSEAALIKALSTSSGRIRVGLIGSLARRGVKSPLYAKLLADPDPDTAAMAAYALGETGTAADAALLLKSPAGKDAALRLAERLGPQGRSIYEKIPGVASLEGLARIDGKKALPLLSNTAKTGDPAMQAEAIRLMAANEGEAELTAMTASLPPLAQVRALTALAERAYRPARPQFLAAASSQEPGVRIAALRGLAAVGAAEDAEMLAKRAASTEGAEQEAARSALARLRGQEVDERIVRLMNSMEGKEKVELIRALADRGTGAAAPELIAAAKSADRDVRREAYRALRDVAPAQSAPDLVALMSSAKSASDRREAERMVASVYRRSTKASLAPLEKEYANAPTAEAKSSVLAVLGQAGREESLPLLRSAMSGGDPQVRRASILAMSEWPNQAPAEDLYKAAQGESDAALKVLALRGYIKLVSMPSEKTPAEAAAQLERALKVATQPEEKKAVLAALPKFVCAESLTVARSLLNDAAVAAEAKTAAARLEQALSYRR